MKLSKRAVLALLDGFEPSTAELFELVAFYVRENKIDVSAAGYEWLPPSKRRRLGLPATPKNERRAVRRQAAKLQREGHRES